MDIKTGLNKSMVNHIYEKVNFLKSKIELKKNDLNYRYWFQ